MFTAHAPLLQVLSLKPTELSEDVGVGLTGTESKFFRADITSQLSNFKSIIHTFSLSFIQTVLVYSNHTEAFKTKVTLCGERKHSEMLLLLL